MYYSFDAYIWHFDETPWATFCRRSELVSKILLEIICATFVIILFAFSGDTWHQTHERMVGLWALHCRARGIKTYFRKKTMPTIIPNLLCLIL